MRSKIYIFLYIFFIGIQFAPFAASEEKDEIKKQEKDQEKLKKEQTFLEREEYKKVVTAIAQPHIQVGDVETIVKDIFEDEPPEDLTEVKDLDVLKDPIKKLEKIIKEELDTGVLQRVLPEYKGQVRDVYAIHAYQNKLPLLILNNKMLL